MKSIQELREVRAEKSKAIKAHVEKKNWKVAEDQPKADALYAEYDEINSQIAAIEKAMKIQADDAVIDRLSDASGRLGKDGNSKGVSLYGKWLRNGFDNFTAEDHADYRNIKNTMSVGTNSQGGFTVQTDVSKQILDALAMFGGMRSVANVIQTGGGAPMQFPSSDGRSESGEWIGENASANALDIGFATIPLNVFKASSKTVTVPFELLQDSQADVETFVQRRLVTRLGRLMNTGFTVGTGTGQPTGIVTAAGSGFVAANSTSQVTTFTYDSLVELVHSIDPWYRKDNCGWMMHDSSMKKIRQIKDAQNRPIFVPGYTMGIPGQGFTQPDTIMGYGVTTNQDMPVMAANAKSIAFGNFKFYTIRDVMALEMFRFNDSAFITKGQIGFLAWARSGGNLIDVGGAVKLLVNAAS